MKPTLAMCNFIQDITSLKAFAIERGFSGIDWSFEIETLPKTPSEESQWVKAVSTLQPLDVRYHCPFHKIDLGHHDPAKAKEAATLFRRIIRLIAKTGGGYLSIHIGLGRNSTEPLSWDETIQNLRRLVQYGSERNVKVCIENLAWGWTSKPNLFEKLVRKSGAWVTFDIGHAQVCESVSSQQYAVEDFVTPHADRVLNAHIYHVELSGIGHIPPENLADIKTRLSLLQHIGCTWWIIEIKEEEPLLKTKQIIDEFLHENDSHPFGRPGGSRLQGA
jgi:sugar phosphate isomerase/epimerase